jgi:hypothetical protein
MAFLPQFVLNAFDNRGFFGRWLSWEKAEAEKTNLDLQGLKLSWDRVLNHNPHFSERSAGMLFVCTAHTAPRVVTALMILNNPNLDSVNISLLRVLNTADELIMVELMLLLAMTKVSVGGTCNISASAFASNNVIKHKLRDFEFSHSGDGDRALYKFAAHSDVLSIVRSHLMQIDKDSVSAVERVLLKKGYTWDEFKGESHERTRKVEYMNKHHSQDLCGPNGLWEIIKNNGGYPLHGTTLVVVNNDKKEVVGIMLIANELDDRVRARTSGQEQYRIQPEPEMVPADLVLLCAKKNTNLGPLLVLLALQQASISGLYTQLAHNYTLRFSDQGQPEVAENKVEMSVMEKILLRMDFKEVDVDVGGRNPKKGFFHHGFVDRNAEEVYVKKFANYAKFAVISPVNTLTGPSGHVHPLAGPIDPFDMDNIHDHQDSFFGEIDVGTLPADDVATPLVGVTNSSSSSSRPRVRSSARQSPIPVINLRNSPVDRDEIPEPPGTHDENCHNHVRRRMLRPGPIPANLVCPICNGTFSRAANLARHVAEHTRREHSDRPHACPDCPRRFFRLADLQTHHLRVHEVGDPAARPYICKVPGGCATGYAAKTKSDLFAHQRRQVHNIPDPAAAMHYAIRNPDGSESAPTRRRR